MIHYLNKLLLKIKNELYNSGTSCSFSNKERFIVVVDYLKYLRCSQEILKIENALLSILLFRVYDILCFSSKDGLSISNDPLISIERNRSLVSNEEVIVVVTLVATAAVKSICQDQISILIIRRIFKEQ